MLFVGFLHLAFSLTPTTRITKNKSIRSLLYKWDQENGNQLLRFFICLILQNVISITFLSILMLIRFIDLGLEALYKSILHDIVFPLAEGQATMRVRKYDSTFPEHHQLETIKNLV